jgi:hypothetical protein
LTRTGARICSAARTSEPVGSTSHNVSARVLPLDKEGSFKMPQKTIRNDCGLSLDSFGD